MSVFLAKGTRFFVADGVADPSYVSYCTIIKQLEDFGFCTQDIKKLGVAKVVYPSGKTEWFFTRKEGKHWQFIKPTNRNIFFRYFRTSKCEDGRRIMYYRIKE